jgi:hypothetical protein
VTLARELESRVDLARRPADANEAARAYGKACDLDYAPACVLRSAVLDADVDPTQEPACASVEQSCVSNDPLGCRAAGLCRTGDPAASTAAFSRACQLGDAEGCLHYAWRRAVASFGPSSHEDSSVLFGVDMAAVAEAAAAYRWACAAELAEGCVAVVARTHHTVDDRADPGRAQRLAHTWCERGANNACHVSAGYFNGLWPYVATSDPSQWPAPDPTSVAALIPDGAGVGRVGFCLRDDGATERVATLDSLGDDRLDAFLRDTVARWRFNRRAAFSEPICLVHTFLVRRDSKERTGLRVIRHGAGAHGGITVFAAAP